MRQVALVTTFRGDDEAYSLCNVANDQLKMLVSAGYKPVVLVTEGFDKGHRMFAHDNVELRYLPDQNRSNEIEVDESFEEDVAALEEAMINNLRDIEVVITHDITYQPDALKHRVALLSAHSTILPRLRFMHWIHSFTPPKKLSAQRGSFPQRYRDATKDVFPDSYYIFMNEWSRPHIAREHGGIPESFVKVIHHPTDYFKFAKYDQDSIDFINKYNLHSVDIMAIYPARLDTGKQVDGAIKIMASLKKLNYSVRFVSVDFHSSSDEPNDPKFKYRQRLKDIAVDWGLNQDELLFTSEHKPEWKVSVPYTVVHDLFDISNLFIMPSGSESFSLVTQEAALKSNLLVLNRNFPPFREVFGEQTIQAPFNSNVNIPDIMDGGTTLNYENREAEMQDYIKMATNIAVDLKTKQNITRRRLLKTRSLEYIFRHEFEPTMDKLFQDFPLPEES